MTAIKPVFVQRDGSVSPSEAKAVIEGIEAVLEIVGASEKIQVVDYGVWRAPGFEDLDGALVSHKSIDWYLKHGRDSSTDPNQLDSTQILSWLAEEPLKKELDHYDVIITGIPINKRSKYRHFGDSAVGVGSVISASSFHELGPSLSEEVLKTLAMHEFAHVIGAPDEKRPDLQNFGGLHCRNKCVMRQKSEVYDWGYMTYDRMVGPAFCDPCRNDMVRYLYGTK